MKNFESQPFCLECSGPKNYKGGFDHYENCSLAKEEGETEEEFIAGEIKENPELPESEFVKYHEQKKIEEEADNLLKDVFVKKEKNEGVEKIADRITHGLRGELAFSHDWEKEKREEYLADKIDKFINMAIKQKEITEEERKAVWDSLEQKEKNTFYSLKKKRYLPIGE